MDRLRVVADLFAFAQLRRTWWLWPLLVTLVLLALLMALSAVAPIAPLVYPLF